MCTLQNICKVQNFIYIRTDRDGPGRTGTDQDGPGRTGPDQDGPGRTRTDRDGSGRTDGPGRTRTDQDGPGRTRTDRDSYRSYFTYLLLLIVHTVWKYTCFVNECSYPAPPSAIRRPLLNGKVDIHKQITVTLY